MDTMADALRNAILDKCYSGWRVRQQTPEALDLETSFVDAVGRKARGSGKVVFGAAFRLALAVFALCALWVFLARARVWPDFLS